MDSRTFLSPAMQAKLAHLWEVCSQDGLLAHRAIEQLSCLLTLRLLERDGPASPLTLPSHLHWHALLASDEDRLTTTVEEAMTWLRTGDLNTDKLFDAATVHFSKPSLLREAMQLLDDVFSPTLSGEICAMRYDALLTLAQEAAASWAAPGGKYYTPHHLAHLLCWLVRPQPAERIYDFACGNGRLLASAIEYLARAECDTNRRLYGTDGQPVPLEEQDWSGGQRALLGQTRLIGIDNDTDAVLQSRTLLHCLNAGKPALFALDALSQQAQQHLDATGLGQVDVLLGNPPYGSVVDERELATDLRGLGTTRAELLFLQLAFRLLRPGGRAAIILPDSFLFKRDRATVALRHQLVTEHGLHAIISLPAGVFYPSTGVKTSILVFTHSGQTNTIWCYSVAKDGYSLDKRRRPISDNDLPDLMVKYGWQWGRESLEEGYPPAFLDDDTVLQWENIEPERRSYHYV